MKKSYVIILPYVVINVIALRRELKMNFLSDFFKGLFIGIGAIAPGVSGGTLAVIFGIYEKITEAVANIFSDFKEKVVLFFPLALGSGVGIIAFGKIMNYLFANFNTEVRYLFIGLMIGTFPALFKKANKNGFHKTYYYPFIIALGLTLLFAGLGNNLVATDPIVKPETLDLITYGIIIGFGTIVPGISASIILMYIGAYQQLLEAIANIDIAMLIPTGIGFIISIIIFAKIINLLFKRFYGYTYYAVLGFVIGSIVPIFPGIALDWQYLLPIALFIIGLALSYYLSKFEKDVL